jgi:hypothetical protein
VAEELLVLLGIIGHLDDDRGGPLSSKARATGRMDERLGGDLIDAKPGERLKRLQRISRFVRRNPRQFIREVQFGGGLFFVGGLFSARGNERGRGPSGESDKDRQQHRGSVISHGALSGRIRGGEGFAANQPAGAVCRNFMPGISCVVGPALQEQLSGAYRAKPHLNGRGQRWTGSAAGTPPLWIHGRMNRRDRPGRQSAEGVIRGEVPAEMIAVCGGFCRLFIC